MKDINTDFEECPDFSTEPGSMYIKTRLSRFTMYVNPEDKPTCLKSTSTEINHSNTFHI
jgi:hypothetical protein